MLARRVQAIIDACAQDARNPKWTIARHFSGVLVAWTNGVDPFLWAAVHRRVREVNEANPTLASGPDDENADKKQPPGGRREG